ncbi:MAG: TIGR02710 family CRISPR-associated CARF protein [Desulfobacter postgatei]|uniref:TIGR02710 family CRISPR-associated CARF protein n=1 Tax=Desulfobacter postgatei TaxID=2293 RepID=UPI0023F124D1|nr:TIGR02710 family CRISPR-associated CARF protein [Desulfobacter postgatei]MDD4272340.1 TIGR02710 family CRISPR-associated CARF protein [Desulfobacter postgatei]
MEDLLKNAQRRESQSRYDDAVGRIYRALELMIQLYLKKEYDILTGDVDLSKLPDTAREKYEVFRAHDSGPIQISLKSSYELLFDLSDKTLQPLYQTNANRIEGILSIRNYSLFAHGFKSISKEQYEKFWEVAASFLYDAIQAASSASTKKWEFLQLPNYIV